MGTIIPIMFGDATIPLVDDRGTPWQEALAIWTGWMKASQKPPTTINLRTYHMRRFAGDHPKVEPFDLTLDMLIAWLAKFEWKAETRRSYRASLRTFCHWAHVSGRATTNPAALLPPIRPAWPNPRPTPDDVFELAMLRATPDVRLMLRLAAHATMRRGEIARCHSDWLARDSDGWLIHIIGKGNKPRVVPLMDDLAEQILAGPPGFLFPGKIDGHLSPAYVGKLMSRVLDGTWTAHTLRHRFGSRGYEKDRDIRAMQALLGHASVATTQIYVRVPSGALRSAVAAAA